MTTTPESSLHGNSHPSFLVPALVAASAIGVIAYVWFTVAHVERRLQTLDGFEGMHFEA